jgi:hypothetical protein
MLKHRWPSNVPSLSMIDALILFSHQDILLLIGG